MEVSMTKKRQIGPTVFEGDTDKRLIEKMLREKSASQEDLQNYLEGVPDCSDNADEFAVELTRRS
jgi:hypothetical protein